MVKASKAAAPATQPHAATPPSPPPPHEPLCGTASPRLRPKLYAGSGTRTPAITSSSTHEVITNNHQRASPSDSNLLDQTRAASLAICSWAASIKIDRLMAGETGCARNHSKKDGCVHDSPGYQREISGPENSNTLLPWPHCNLRRNPSAGLPPNVGRAFQAEYNTRP